MCSFVLFRSYYFKIHSCVAPVVVCSVCVAVLCSTVWKATAYPFCYWRTLDVFPLGDIMNKAAVNILVKIFLGTFLLDWCQQGWVLMGLDLYLVLGETARVLQSSCMIYTPTSDVPKLWSLWVLCTHSVVSPVRFSHFWWACVCVFLSFVEV